MAGPAPSFLGLTHLTLLPLFSPLSLLFTARTLCNRSVYDLGLSLFREVVIYRPQVHEFLRSTLLEMIRQERNGDVVDRSKIKTCCHMLVVLGINNRRVYETTFEQQFLQEAAEFYRLEGQKFLQDQNVSG